MKVSMLTKSLKSYRSRRLCIFTLSRVCTLLRWICSKILDSISIQPDWIATIFSSRKSSSTFRSLSWYSAWHPTVDTACNRSLISQRKCNTQLRSYSTRDADSLKKTLDRSCHRKRAPAIQALIFLSIKAAGSLITDLTWSFALQDSRRNWLHLSGVGFWSSILTSRSLKVGSPFFRSAAAVISSWKYNALSVVTVSSVGSISSPSLKRVLIAKRLFEVLLLRLDGQLYRSLLISQEVRPEEMLMGRDDWKFENRVSFRLLTFLRQQLSQTHPPTQ